MNFRKAIVIMFVMSISIAALAANVSGLAELGRIDAVSYDSQGRPNFVAGDLGKLAEMTPEAAAPEFVNRLAKSFGISSTIQVKELQTESDELGQIHVRLLQQYRGLPIVGADMIVHSNAADGRVLAWNGRMVDTSDLPTEVLIADTKAVGFALEEAGIRATILGDPELSYVVDDNGDVQLAWRATVTYDSNEGEERDEIFASAIDGSLAARHPQIYRSKYRKIYSSNNGSSLPGSLLFNEGGSSSDTTAMKAYNYTGATYDYYLSKFNRDSYNGAGATLTSSVHFQSNYNNAYWNGSQMVFGDGDGSTFSPLAGALDVVAHELTHAVTERTANLVYAKESGALNEAWSDIIGSSVEAYEDGGVSSQTWLLGEDIYTPGTSGDALRYMANPTADGYSTDYYPERLYSGTCTPNANTNDNCGVHGNSGIANLAYVLLVQGGSHPRGKTSVSVPALGISKSEQIFYRALVTYMTSSTNFQGARNATAQAAQDLYGASTAAAVQKCWDAVGVPGGVVTITTLSNGVAVNGLSGSTGAEAQYQMAVSSGASNLVFEISGGSGDCDLYVKRGSMPTTSSYDCRPYKTGNAETCTFASPASGTWYVMLDAYAAYSSVRLVGSFSTGAPNQAPTANFSFTTNDLTASFTDASSDPDGTIASRSWNFGDGATSTSTNPSHTYAAAGTKTVTLTVTDNDGATDGYSRSVTVTAPAGGGAPCTNCTEYTGSLKTSGSSAIQPNGTYYYHSKSGIHEGWLEGPSGTDFDLELYKWSNSRWTRVASSTSSSSSEHISYNATTGYYYWKIISYSGTGSYSFWLKKP